MGLQVLQIELVCNLGVILDLQLLLQEQIVAVATRAFAHLHVVHKLWLFLDHDHGYSCLGHLPTGLLYMGLSLKSTQKLQLLPNAVGWAVTCTPHSAYWPLFHKLRWFPAEVYFWAQLKVLVVTCQAPHSWVTCGTISPWFSFLLWCPPLKHHSFRDLASHKTLKIRFLPGLLGMGLSSL